MEDTQMVDGVKDLLKVGKKLDYLEMLTELTRKARLEHWDSL
jgi:hypothetical protein